MLQKYSILYNVIPAMTSNTSPSGVASASSEYQLVNGSYYKAYRAFNHAYSSDTSAWLTLKGTPTGWLAYEFPDAKCITKYTIISRVPVSGGIAELPRDWTFEAWDEQSNEWVVLDTETGVTDWMAGEVKEFTFVNNNLYYKYRINIIANGGNNLYTAIGELEMMETVSVPSNLIATGGNGNIQLSWNSVLNAQKYVIKRGTTPNGPFNTTIPYEPVVTGPSISFVDTDVTPGTTYYYVVSAVVSGTESPNSIEASATPTEGSTPPDHTGDTATLILTMTNGGIKEYGMSIDELDDFLTWYNSSSNGNGYAYYIFSKTNNIAPYLSIKEYISFDKISSFEVKEYNE